MSIRLPNMKQVSLLVTEIWPKIQTLRRRPPKSVILGHSNPDMVNLYQHTKFEAKIFINDRYMAKNPKFNLTAAAILSFGKSGIWGHSILDMLMSISMPNLERIPSQMKEMWPKIQKRPPPSWIFAKECNFCITYTRVATGKYRFAYEIWWKSAQKWFIYTCVYTLCPEKKLPLCTLL